MLEIPDNMDKLLRKAAEHVRDSKKVLALSHIDTDGITSLAIVIRMLERLGKVYRWRNIHQLNSETINDVKDLIEETSPDLVIFSDFGTGQLSLIQDHLADVEGLEHIIILDHHIPPEERAEINYSEKDEIIEINPCQQGISGSSELSGAGVSFLLAISVSEKNIDLSELAIVGATGDLQDYYGKGFAGINAQILDIAVQGNYIRVERDLTLFGINTRPLPQLLQFATDPYLPGLTGDAEACYQFYSKLGIELKDSDDQWRRWVDLSQEEKQKVVQQLIGELLQFYDDPRIATGLVGDVINLLLRPPRSEMSTAKEFSTLLNACGRNRRSDVGVGICLGDEESFQTGKALLQQHRANLAMAIRRIEDNGFEEYDGIYVVNDPQTKDTIIGIVIGMAQGSTIIPSDKPVIGISTNTTEDSPLVKISGRARNHVVKKGVNLKEVFTHVAESLNEKAGRLTVEAGGHPMAAGAFVDPEYLDAFINGVSKAIANIIH